MAITYPTVIKRGPLITVDDSGDAGFKFDHGSSRHFVLACIVFKDSQVAEQVAEAMIKLRESKGWSPKAELNSIKLVNQSSRSCFP